MGFLSVYDTTTLNEYPFLVILVPGLIFLAVQEVGGVGKNFIDLQLFFNWDSLHVTRKKSSMKKKHKKINAYRNSV